MKTRILLELILVGCLLIKATNGYATIDPIKPDYEKNRSEFENIRLNNPNSVVLQGEIIGIDDDEILITKSTAGKDVLRLKLVQETKIYCNGTDSEWEALKPVAPKAYFEAQVLMNMQTEAIAVNAFYYGEECIVKKCFQNQGQLFLQLNSALSEEVYTYPVAKEARLPLGESWSQAGQTVYILFNGAEEIRAVFLPDH